jgi:hypothetical protein
VFYQIISFWFEIVGLGAYMSSGGGAVSSLVAFVGLLGPKRTYVVAPKTPKDPKGRSKRAKWTIFGAEKASEIPPFQTHWRKS